MNKQSGQLLIEILIAIVVVVAIASLGAQLVLVGEKSNEITGNKDTALKLVEETFEAVRSIATENWINIHGANKGSGNPYYLKQESGKWVLDVIYQPVSINGIDYTRSFYIENVGRDLNKNIVLTGGTDDPSTQKITASVSWIGGGTVSGSEYVTRWRSKVCVQTDWNGGSGEQSDCTNPANTWSAKDDWVDTTGESLKLQ